MFRNVRLNGKTALLLAALLFSSIGAGFVSADPLNLWRDSGSNIFYDQGKVGIGTTNPQSPLHVFNSAGGEDVTIETPNGFSDLTLRSGSTSWCWTTNGFTGNFEVVKSCNGITAFSINPDGNVGIGTTNPQSPLHVFNAGGGEDVTIETPNGFSDLTLRSGSTSWCWATNGFTGDFSVVKGCNGITPFDINSAGNVGIGTTNPISKLAVKGLPTSPPDSSGNAGIVCITNDGNMWIDTTPFSPC